MTSLTGAATKRIIARFDARGIYVYQAFSPHIVEAAVANGTFGEGFSLDRMTWIKPSFGWMLNRSAYATSLHQEAVARIHLRHEGFLAILERAVPTIYDPRRFASETEWTVALSRSDVRCQWDPDRDLHDRKLARRAVQLGIRGETVRRYVDEWILGVENVTPLAHAIGAAVAAGETELPKAPEEIEYPLPPHLERSLGYDSTMA